MGKVNFLPDDYLDKKAQQRTNVICLTLFFMVMAGVAAGLIVTEKRQKTMTEREDDVRKKFVKASESLKQMEVLEKKKEQMMQKASVSASLMESVPRSLLLATITNQLPSGISLLEYDLVSKVEKKQASKAKRSRNKRSRRNKKDAESEEKEELAPEKVKTTIGIEGVAGTDMQVAKYIAQLNRSPMFSQVNLVFSEEYNLKDETLRRFKLQMELDVNAKATKSDVELARQSTVSGM